MAGTGIVLYHGIDSGEELADYARTAEDAGFDSLWVTERYFHEETFSMLGYLAARTERIRLGVGVVNPYTRHPALLGMGAATLDRLSGGRMTLGLGRSDADVIAGRMGMEYRAPLSRLRGTVAALRRMWNGERVTEDHAGVRLRNVGLAIHPVQDPLPIYLAAIGPRALRLAGEVADGVLLNAYAPVEYIRWAVKEVRDAASNAGRDPGSIDITCMLIVRLTDDPGAMLPSLRERVARLVAEPLHRRSLARTGRIRHLDPGPRQGTRSERRRVRRGALRLRRTRRSLLPPRRRRPVPPANPRIHRRRGGHAAPSAQARSLRADSRIPRSQ